MENNSLLSNSIINRSNMSNDYTGQYLRKLPPGYRWLPTDEELVDFLCKKVNIIPMPFHRIHEVDLYRFHPQELTDMYKRVREHDWFFFTSRSRYRLPGGYRPAGDGYWISTGIDMSIPRYRAIPVGYRKSLNYYEGKHPNVAKTKWKMHEYTLLAPSSSTTAGEDQTKMKDWVLCRIYKSRCKSNQDEDQHEEILEEEVDQPRRRST
ncbi:hypothetical protein K2173_001997 [Erythroxylum novogranatense]|uniref:NAC domain-containing protein n=1 Tax=Erythroxylum novogranatense TaxID=1862640 RepID=A0AAV8SQ23_9ROSI|nr:hypothetical protein K2173_001997 [Erythroxylum novogranatense]